MTTQIDWQHEIDSAFGSGDDQPVGHYVAAGRRAVRRRRRATAAAGLLVAAVVAGLAWSVAPDASTSRSDAPVATDGDGVEAAPAWSWRDDEPPARFGLGGVEVRDGAVVHDRRDDLYPGKGTDSAALDVSFEGQRWWVALEWDSDQATSSAVRPDDGLFRSFEAFVAERVRGGGMITESGPDEGGTR